jgi:hypothetical protein
MSILDTKITDRGASGQRDLLPAGTYKSVEIKNLEEMELNERDRENNNIARLRCDMVDLDTGLEFARYVNVKKGKEANPHPMSTHFQIMAALWPKVEDRVGKTFRDWIGAKLEVVVFHITNDQGNPAEDVRFTPHEG